MTRSLIPLLLLTALLALPLSPPAASRTAFAPPDINRIATLADPAISPDGRWVAYTVTTTDAARDSEQQVVWRVRIDGREDAPLTHTPGADNWGAAWSSDGKSIVFLSDRKGADGKDVGIQVWEMPAAGGVAHQITRLPAGVEAFAISPDATRLAVIALDPERAPGSAKPANPPPFVTTRYHFKNDEQGWLGARYKHLYVVDVASGRATLLTPGKRDQHLPVWSPDGRRIAYVSKGGAHPDRTMDYKVYVIDAHAGAAARLLTTLPGDDLDPYWESRPAWSPDGKSIAYLHSLGGKWADYAPSRLAVIDVASGAGRLLTTVDRSFFHPVWSPDGRSVYALLEEAQVTHLVRVDVASGRLVELDHGDRFDANFAVSRSGHVIVLGGDDLHPYNLSVLARGKLRTIANHNEWLAGVRLAATKTLHFTDPDGARIDALLMQPDDGASRPPYPTILRVHGGPVYQFSHEFHADWQVYAANGYAVLAVNPRGSSGRGFDFAKAIYADWGNKDGQDLLAGVDHLVKLGIADAGKLGIGGWSYGAILTDQMIARTTRFKAAVSGAGTGNMYGMYGDDEYALDYEVELGVPWKPVDRATWDRVSYPFLHADRITTPTLFQCGGIDFNVPCIGSEQLYQALRSLDVPTELVVYPGQHHEFTTPSYLIDRMQRDLAWYDRFLKPPDTSP
ncbi:MAG TPA: S9 family peptidase [Rhodanobacteraceae bacterium]|nr:S9 family peptidase [Rhodanobacteraceae bacterium]